MFFTKMGPGPCMEESLVTTVKPSPSGPSREDQENARSPYAGITLYSILQ